MHYAIRYTFTEHERLKREQHIDTLFRTGKAFSFFPVKFLYNIVPRGAELSPVRIAFSVPKKKFRRANKRNKVRRLLREAWRLQKHTLYEAIPPAQQLHIFLLYIHIETTDLPTAMQAIAGGIQKLKVIMPAHA